jgi:hypothetical protein
MTRRFCRSPDGKWLVSGAMLTMCVCVCVCVRARALVKPPCTTSGSADNKIVLWDTSSWALYQELAVSASHVLALAWRVLREPDDDASIISHVLAAGTWEGHMLIWLGTNSSIAEGEL